MKCLLGMGKSINFWRTNGCSCENIIVFETKNVSTWGWLEPPTFGFMPNTVAIWAIRARHLVPHVVKHWLWSYKYFWSKVDIWNVNWTQVTTFIFDTQTGFLEIPDKIAATSQTTFSIAFSLMRKIQILDFFFSLKIVPNGQIETKSALV